MPTATLLFIALLAIYVAASGRAKKVLEALGATASDTAPPVQDTSGQGSPGGTEQTNTNLLSNNAALYNTRLTNPGSLNTETAAPYQTNYGYSSDPYDFTGWSGNGYLGPPLT